MRALAVVVATAGLMFGFGLPAASAATLCDEVATGGYFMEHRDVQECYQVNSGYICHEEDAGLDPWAHVYTFVCVPSVKTDS